MVEISKTLAKLLSKWAKRQEELKDEILNGLMAENPCIHFSLLLKYSMSYPDLILKFKNGVLTL